MDVCFLKWKAWYLERANRRLREERWSSSEERAESAALLAFLRDTIAIRQSQLSAAASAAHQLNQAIVNVHAMAVSGGELSQPSGEAPLREAVAHAARIAQSCRRSLRDALGRPLPPLPSSASSSTSARQSREAAMSHLISGLHLQSVRPSPPAGGATSATTEPSGRSPVQSTPLTERAEPDVAPASLGSPARAPEASVCASPPRARHARAPPPAHLRGASKLVRVLAPRVSVAIAKAWLNWRLHTVAAPAQPRPAPSCTPAPAPAAVHETPTVGPTPTSAAFSPAAWSAPSIASVDRTAAASAAGRRSRLHAVHPLKYAPEAPTPDAVRLHRVQAAMAGARKAISSSKKILAGGRIPYALPAAAASAAGRASDLYTPSPAQAAAAAAATASGAEHRGGDGSRRVLAF